MEALDGAEGAGHDDAAALIGARHRRPKVRHTRFAVAETPDAATVRHAREAYSAAITLEMTDEAHPAERDAMARAAATHAVDLIVAALPRDVARATFAAALEALR